MKLLLRAALSVACVALLVWKLGLDALAAPFSQPHPGWIAAAFAAVLAAIALSAWKWGLILRSRGIALPFPRLLRHYFVGLLFNNLLPTAVGGDAVRAWETGRDTGRPAEAVASVLGERLIAGMALGVTALLGLPFIAFDARLLALALAFLALDLGVAGLFLLPRTAERAAAALLPRHAQALRAGVDATVAAVRATLRQPRLCLQVALASIAFQVLVAAVNACLFRALGTPVSLAHCIVLTPMIFTLAMLPVSIAGLGVREAAYAAFFTLAGVAPAEAVACSLAFFVIVGIASLPGAPLFALGRRRAGTAPAAADPASLPPCR